MRKVKLTQGKFALVDDADFEAIGAFKWCLQNQGYATRNIRIGGQKKMVMMHRAILGAQANEQVDHINCNRLDNRRCNLRIVIPSQNMQNHKDIYGAVAFRGVSFSRSGRFRAQIGFKRKIYCLGTFDAAIDAARSYDRAAVKFYGRHARLNFPLTEAEVLKLMST